MKGVFKEKCETDEFQVNYFLKSSQTLFLYYFFKDPPPIHTFC